MIDSRYRCLFLFFLVSVTTTFSRPRDCVQPHFEARKQESVYHGSGRDDPPPESLAEVRLGYFGPSGPEDPEGGALWLAAQLAIEEANREGGYNGLPFRLIPSWSQNPWGSGISRLARSIYTDQLWAIVGSIDGASTHLAEQLVAKARLTLLNPATSDKTVNLANVPWMFSCLPGEHLQAPVLAKGIAESAPGSVLTLVSATDHDSRVFAKELKDNLAEAGVFTANHFEIDGRESKIPALVDQILSAGSEVVVVLAEARQSGHLVRSLRESRFLGPIFGGPNMGRFEFLREAGSTASGVTFPQLVSVRRGETLVKTLKAELGTSPDYRALQTYDAVTLLIEAIRRAGLNRVRIRDALRELSPWDGISGPVIWDALGQNKRPVRLTTIPGE